MSVELPARAVAAQSWLTPVELGALGAIWGASFLFMRVAAKDFGAFALVEVRLVLGAAILLPFLMRERARFTRGMWVRLAGIAAINSAIPFSLFAWAAQRAPAGIGAITNATAVMFTALAAFVMYRESIGRWRLMGLVLGFVGVTVLASGKVEGGSVLPAALAGTCAAMLYGIGGNLIRRYLVGIPASAVAAATLVCASLLLAPLAISMWPAVDIPMRSWLCAAALGIFCTGIAYLLYYRLIYRIGAAGASTVTYLVPLFGVIWAWVFLAEPLTTTMAIAGALILSGVALSQRAKKP
ncbi:MAG TPA: DMT family transporter [Steroidobacteraceae bacterium]|nr:DMT family transporter [Steroidobacteraceae bacterium]